MKKIISYWSFKNGLENTHPIDAAFDEAKAAGFDGVELAIAPEGLLTPQTDQRTFENVRASAQKKNCAVETLASGMSWAFSPTSNDAATRKKSIELHKAALQRAAWLGAETMLFVPGAVKIPWNANYGPVPYDKAVHWAKDAVSSLAKTAEKLQVDLCIENVWNGMFYSPLEFANFVDSIGSPRVGVYFDVGNVLGYHQHPPAWIQLLAERIKRVHIKDFKNSIGNITGFCDLLEGDVPWKEVVQALRQVGYDKTVVAEMMPPAPGLLERTSKAMDQIFAM
jgi:hexulose-6-phosphate isomerase